MSDLKRRDFLKIVGLSGAGTSLLGCAQEPAEKLIPYLVQPEGNVPGLATWYASACRECPAGCGLHVKVREGRPVKVEGNPDHPVNAGRLCARGQASLQGLYNPDRIKNPLRRVPGTDEFEPLSWDEAEGLLADRIAALRSEGRADALYFMTEGAIGSFDRLCDLWMETVGSGNRVIHDSFGLEPLREANRLTFGLPEIPRYELDNADYVLSLGAGFLDTWISPVQYARRFTEAHSYDDGHMARFVHVAPRLSLTGSNADEWVKIRAASEAWLALALIHVIVGEGRDNGRGDAIAGLVEPFTPERAAQAAEIEPETVVRLAHEFAEAPTSLALPPDIDGTHRSATHTHVAVNLLNYVAGNMGRTVRFGPSVARRRNAGMGRLSEMVQAMRDGDVAILMVRGIDPSYVLPSGLRFGEALADVDLMVSFASYMDETAADADLILPDHTPAESWDDHQPEAAVHTLMQPTVEPLFDTKQTGDVLLSVARRLEDAVAERFPWSDYRGFLRDAWRQLQREFAPGVDFEDFWTSALARGGVWREAAAQPVTLNPAVSRVSFPEPDLDGDGPAALVPYPSSSFYDGRGANRPWLQELPDPVTKIVWDSWVELHPDRAEALGVETGDLLEVVSPHGSIELPAFIYHGIHPEAVAIPIGQGHEHLGRYARGRGANPLELLGVAADTGSDGIAWLSVRVGLRPTGRRVDLPIVQGSTDDRGREVAELIGMAAATEAEREATEALHSGSDMLVEAAEDADPKSPYRWGMAIDLSSCTGCSACVTACYAENNIPVVGADGCREGREMAWIRVERYYEHLTEGAHGAGHDAEGGDRPGDHVVHLPMLCQHCGNAPCEPVCPVYAAYHTPEGLNAQVYNRCVGTRYCSNNCPYKVRRFEWFQPEFPYPLNLQLNPDVTVRSKGVMEKCTFCVQRITAAKNEASSEDRTVEDGEIVPACAQTCPGNAIVFGNLRDPDSRVSRLARKGRGYPVLGELNTRPAITYLRQVTRGVEEA